MILEKKFPFFWIRLVKTISGEVRRISDESIVEQPVIVLQSAMLRI